MIKLWGIAIILGSCCLGYVVISSSVIDITIKFTLCGILAAIIAGAYLSAFTSKGKDTHNEKHSQ